jgi:hypothetical protein
MATVFTEKNLRGNQGGHQGLVGFQIDEKELKGLIKSIEKLGMSDSQTKVKLRQGMRKAAKPLVEELRGEIEKVEGKNNVGNKNRATGRLKKSIAVINGKMRRGAAPAVYVGPRVKGAFADKKKSGFHFFFLEYGFKGKPGARMLDKVYASGTAKMAQNNVINEIKKEIERLWSKRLA